MNGHRSAAELPVRPWLLLVIIAVFYLFGIFFHLLPATSAYMELLTPYVLLVVGAVVLYTALREGDRGLAVWAAGMYALTFFLEALGVATGAVFGSYHYGEVLGAHVFGVPPVIGFNWVLVLLGCVRASEKLTSSAVAAALFTGATAVMFDLVLEPVAISLGYWTWEGGSIPLQNYVAWFIIAAVGGWVYRRTGLSTRSVVPSWYVVIQLAFFAGLRLSGAA
jgi:putative membrane protein